MDAGRNPSLAAADRGASPRARLGDRAPAPARRLSACCGSLLARSAFRGTLTLRSPGTGLHARAELRRARQHLAAGVRHRASLSIAVGRAAGLGHGAQRHAAAPVVHALVALSYITPPYLTALAYIILMGPDAGHFNRLLRWLFGLDAAPFNIFSMGGVIFVIGIHVFAFTYFLTYTALQSVDASLEESAQVLGASRWAVIRAHQSAARGPGHHRRSAARSRRLARPVRAAGDHRHAGTDRLSADPHLRHHRRLSPALGRGGGALADARAADGDRPGHPARLSGAAILRHGRRPRRTHATRRARRLAMAAARLLSGGRLLQRHCADRRAGADRLQQELDRPTGPRQPHAGALQCRPLHRPDRRARHPQQLPARHRCRSDRRIARRCHRLSRRAHASCAAAVCSTISPSCRWACRVR